MESELFNYVLDASDEDFKNMSKIEKPHEMSHEELVDFVIDRLNSIQCASVEGYGDWEMHIKKLDDPKWDFEISLTKMKDYDDDDDLYFTLEPVDNWEFWNNFADSYYSMVVSTRKVPPTIPLGYIGHAEDNVYKVTYKKDVIDQMQKETSGIDD